MLVGFLAIRFGTPCVSKSKKCHPDYYDKQLKTYNYACRKPPLNCPYCHLPDTIILPIFDYQISSIMNDQSQTSATGTLPQPLTVLLQSTVAYLKQAITPVISENVNRLSNLSGWTIGQQLEHLRLSVTGAMPILYGPVKATERSPDQFVKAIKDLFLDFEAKYPSAPVLIPQEKDYDNSTLTTELLDAYEQLEKFIQATDLTDTCVATEFTGIGYLTRLEWVAVAIYHTQRHVKQVKDILKDLKEK